MDRHIPLVIVSTLVCLAALGTLAAQTGGTPRLIGEAVSQRLSDSPLWLSTSGLGVYWLHARLDSRPKYYTYAAYRAVT